MSRFYRVGSALMAAAMVFTCMPQPGLYAWAEEDTPMEMEAEPEATGNIQDEEEQMLLEPADSVALPEDGGTGDTDGPDASEKENAHVKIATTETDDDSLDLQAADSTTDPPVVATEIKFDKQEISLQRGASDSLKVIWTPDNVTNKELKWTSSDPTVATIDNGTVKALKKGETIITAEATNKVYATCKVTVTPCPVQKITLDKTSMALEEDAKDTLEVTLLPDDLNADEKAINIDLGSRPSVIKAELAADGKTINITAKLAGKTTITVSSKNYPEVKASCEVTVTAKPNPVASFEIVPDKMDLYAGGRPGKLAIKAVGVNPDRPVTEEGTLTWTSSDSGSVTVNQDGTVSALAGAAAGTVTISAKTILSNKTEITARNECIITVKQALNPVTAISVSPTRLILEDRKSGSVGRLAIRITPQNAGDKKVKLSCVDAQGNDVTGVISFPGLTDGIATAGDDGTCTVEVQALALPDSQSKSCIIKVEPDANPNGIEPATCSVTVTKYVEHVQQIELPESLTVKEMEEKELTATIVPRDADDKKITWRTSNPEMAVLVNDAGEEMETLTTTAGVDGTSTVKVKGIFLAEDAYDTCEIVAVSNDGSRRGSCKITVEEGDPAVESITLDTDTLILRPNSEASLIPTITPAGAPSRVRWDVDRRGVVRVEGNGKVVALNPGTCVVIARAGRHTARCEVTVKEPYLEVEPAELRYSSQDQLTVEKLREDLEVRFYSLEVPNAYTDVKDDSELSLVVRDPDAELDIELKEEEMASELAKSGTKTLKVTYIPDPAVGVSYVKEVPLTISENPPSELIRIRNMNQATGKLNEKVWNVQNGTTPGKLPLPDVQLLVKDISVDGTETENTVTAAVEWDRAKAAYNPGIEEKEQNFTVNGVVVLPGNVRNPGNVSLAVKVDVNVREKYTDKAVMAPRFSIGTHQTVAYGTELVLTTETEGAEIYYKTYNRSAYFDDQKPTRNDTRYTGPIILTSATTTICAIAVKQGCLDSNYSECTIYVSRDIVPQEPDDPDDVIPDDVTDEDKEQIGGKVPEGFWAVVQAEEEEKDGFAYTGRAIKPVVRVYDGTKLLTEKKDYTLSYKNNVNAGDVKTSAAPPTITVTGKGNYEGKAVVNFVIKPQSIKDDAVLMDSYVAVAYNGKEQKPVPALSWNDKKLVKNKDFTCQEASYIKPGTYEFLVMGTGNFTGERKLRFEIYDGGVPLSKLTFSKVASQKYTGQRIEPDVTVKYKNTTLIKSGNYDITWENNLNVGTASVVITGRGGYKGSKRINFKILPTAKISQAGITLKFDPTTPVYTGDPIKPVCTVSYGGELKEGKDYKLSYQNNTKAGKATVTVTGMGGFTGTKKKTFTIAPTQFENAELGASFPYEKGGCKPKPVVTFGGKKLTEGTDYTLSYKNNTKFGSTGTVTIKGKGNFTGSLVKTFSVTAQDISNLKVSAADKPYQNKANIYKTKVQVIDLNGKALSAGTDYDKGIKYTYASGSKKGEEVLSTDVIPLGTEIQVEVRVTNPKNYYGTVYGTYKFVRADISKAKVSVDTQEYTGKKVKPGKKQIHVTVGGVPLSDSDFEIVSYENNVNQGTAKVTIRGVGNYGGTKTANFKIRKKGIL